MSPSFNEFYQGLRPTLQMLEAERRQAAKSTLLILAVCGGLGLVGGVWAAWQAQHLMFLLFPTVMGFLVGYGLAEWLYIGTYRRMFKFQAIERIVQFVSSELHYDAHSGIGEAAYMASGLFPRTHDRFQHEDLITGTVGQTQLKVSEVHSEYKTKDSKGRTEWHTVFRGLFFILDFPKRFYGSTLVLPDSSSWLGSLGEGWQQLTSRGQLVKLEDPEFERYFKVLASDQVEARYLLSTTLMERIKALRSRGNVRLSFRGGQLYVAIAGSKNLFEPNLFKPLEITDLMEHMTSLKQVLGIVDELQLNTRIWQK